MSCYVWNFVSCGRSVGSACETGVVGRLGMFRGVGAGGWWAGWLGEKEGVMMCVALGAW